MPARRAPGRASTRKPRGKEQLSCKGDVFTPIYAAMVAFHRGSDLLPGMDEGHLNLYRLYGSAWVPAVCPGYEVLRFPASNRVAVPICQTGVFVLSDRTPGLKSYIYVPLVLRNAP